MPVVGLFSTNQDSKMDYSALIMYLGFAMAAYSVVGNDVIQTLGTFLSSNENRPWYVLWLFAGSILTATLVYGWFNTNPQRAIPTEEGYWEVVEGPHKGKFLDYDEAKRSVGSHLVYLSKYKKLQKGGELEQQEAKKIYLYQDLGASASERFERVDSLSGKVTAPYTFTSLSQETISMRSGKVQDVSYNRLERYDYPTDIAWWYLLPPLVLLIITKTGIPVSTSFLILTFFEPKGLFGMVTKSLLGYVVAFAAAMLFYLAVTKTLERRFADNPLKGKNRSYWVVAQWCSTGFLWAQWLIQDFANIYVYLPRDIDLVTLMASLAVILSLLAYIFYGKGGKIQGIVKSKTNTTDIRSATFVDLIYGIVLYIFKELSNIPMSTTWVFIGLLAGREYAIRYQLDGKLKRSLHRMLATDLGKVFLGLVISVVLVWLISVLSGRPVEWV